jgi:hypothetical protein
MRNLLEEMAFTVRHAIDIRCHAISRYQARDIVRTILGFFLPGGRFCTKRPETDAEWITYGKGVITFVDEHTKKEGEKA